MAFSRVRTGRGPLERNRGRTPGTDAPKRPRSTDRSTSTTSRSSSSRANGPVTTVYTQAIGAANALRRKQKKSLKVLRGNTTEAELERVIARNARQVGLGLRSGMWLPTNAIAKTSASTDNQPRKKIQRGPCRSKHRSPSTSPTALLDPIAAQVAAGGAARVIEMHLAANAEREQAYLDECNRDDDRLEALMSGSVDDQTLAAAEAARLQSLLAGTELAKREAYEEHRTQPTLLASTITGNGATVDEEQPVELSYRQQASKLLNTNEAHAARKELRTNQLVSVAIDRLWLLVTGYGRTAQLNRQMFINFHILVQKAIDLDGAFDVFEAERSAELEWEADTALSSKTQQEDRKDTLSRKMSHQQFHDSLFELVDIWTAEISAQAYAAFLWQLLQRISYISVVFDDSARDNFRTREKFSHDRQGASKWEKVRKNQQGQRFAARYCAKTLDAVLSWIHQPTKEIYTHPHLFKVSNMCPSCAYHESTNRMTRVVVCAYAGHLLQEVEEQTQLLRAELIEDDTYMHGAGAVDTSREIVRNSSHSCSGLVSGTAVGWPFDGTSEPKGGALAKKSEVFEVVTGRRVSTNFRDKNSKKNPSSTRKGLADRRMAAFCTCRRCQAVGAVQRLWRGFLGRRRAFRVKMEKDAACAIQNQARRWLARRHAAATMIQRSWRCCAGNVHLRNSNTGIAAVVAPADGAADESSESKLEPQPQESGVMQQDCGTKNHPRLRPYYSHTDDEGEASLDASDGHLATQHHASQQLCLSGVSVAMQRAAVPLLTDLSAEALHRDRERCRQQKAKVTSTAMLKLADAVRGGPSHRSSSMREQRNGDYAQRMSFSMEPAYNDWVPTRTSSQRSTCDPLLLSKLLLRSRSTPPHKQSAGVRRMRGRDKGSLQRPVSAPSSRQPHHHKNILVCGESLSKPI